MVAARQLGCRGEACRASGLHLAAFVLFCFASERVNMSECALTVRAGRLGDASTRRCSRPGEGLGLCCVTWPGKRGDLTRNGRRTHCIRLPSHKVDTFHSELPWAPGRVSVENRLVWICSERIRFSSGGCICLKW